MSTKDEVVSVGTEATAPNAHAEAAQARLQEIWKIRDLIPNFVIPASGKETSRLNAAASLPPEFLEITHVATANEPALVRPTSPTPAELRDLTHFADSYDPLADALEALAQFIRHSTAAARNKVGFEALLTYELARRLSTRPEYAGLATYVADMRRVLGRMRKQTAAERAEKNATKTAKLAAKAAAKLAREKAAAALLTEGAEPSSKSKS